MHEYTVVIQYDKTDAIYVAKVPELPGCMAHGKSREDAIKEIKAAIELWLEVAAEDGEEIPKPMVYAV